ncbi:MAG: T9SS type A sorting domain-containing protein [bacterium]|nr:T9SS type A sorting domain-containing protein [bacterium]
MKKLMLVLAAVVGVLLLVCGRQAQGSWPYLPSWTSGDERFTMSVALADLNHDGYLDLITGNYKYPYQYSGNAWDLQVSDIGDYLVAYEGSGTTPYLAVFPTTYENLPARCIDCIAVADYDKDGDPDVAIGAVVGKGNDGGIWVYDNLYNPLGQGDRPDFDDLFDEDYVWHPNDSYDCHVVRWVDVNGDGDLDLVTLEVNSIIRIYENQYPLISDCGYLDKTPIEFDYQTSDPGQNSINPDDIPLPISGTTMEFGDMDRDGYPDLFVNCGPMPKIFKNIGAPNYFNTANVYTIDVAAWRLLYPYPEVFKENAFCASFGFFNNNPAATPPEPPVLAIGTMNFGDGVPGNSGYFGSWRNDVYALDGNNILQHVWQSDETLDASGGAQKTQLVTDIQWATVAGTQSNMDLVTSSYPTYLNSTTTWDRGQEFLYPDPSQSQSDPFNGTNRTSTWQSSEPDLSTSLALGDVGYHFTYDLNSCTSVEIPVLTVNNEEIGFYYLPTFPFFDIEKVQEYHSDSWHTIDEDLWCYDPVNGWISISTFGEHPPLENSTAIRVAYHPYSEMDLAVGNDGKNALYLWDGVEGTTYPVNPTHEITVVTPTSVNDLHVYDPADYNIDNSNEIDLMAKDAIGGGYTWFWGLFSNTPDEVAEGLEQNPNFKRVLMPYSWNLEIFQGHFFWDRLDQNLDKVYDVGPGNINVHLFTTGSEGPPWVQGQLQIQGDPKNRTTDERLHTMMVRAIVNRYRPNGMYDQYSVIDAGNAWEDWGVQTFQFDNEPENLTAYDYWQAGNQTGRPDAVDSCIIALATRMYYEYQMIKEIGDDPSYLCQLNVVSPNWADHYPYQFSTGTLPPPNASKFRLQPMPYLNALNNVSLSSIPIPGTDQQHVLWRFTDYISQQIYNDKDGTGGPPGQDPFIEEHVGSNEQLKIGFEQLYWGYYTEGLGTYVWEQSGFPADWAPVMQMPGSAYSEHPFVAIEWVYEPDEISFLNDYNTAHLAESFSVDVFPTNAEKNHRLLTNDLSCNFFWEKTPNPVYNSIAGLLNDPGGDGKVCREVKDTVIPQLYNNDDVTVHSITYCPIGEDNPAVDDNWKHWNTFIRTDYGQAGVNQFAKQDWDFTLAEWYSQTGSEEAMYQQHCATPTGNEFEKGIDHTAIEGPPPEWHHTVTVPFNEGEMGPAMLTLNQVTDASSVHDQSITLHTGWNLVSWNIVPPDPDWPITPLLMQEILPTTQLPDPPTWFQTTNGKLWTHEHAEEWWNYPEYLGSGSWVWDLNFAYYLKLDQPHCWNDFTNRELIDRTDFSIEPSAAWDDLDPFNPDAYTNGWFFMGYSAPGYCKLATNFNTPNPPNGGPDYNDYVGPLHWLMWNSSSQNYTHKTQNDQYLIIVKDDKGKVYIPWDPNSQVPTEFGEIDQIGVLEPGRGYFLGFRRPTASINFAGWAAYPGWPQNSLPSDPKVVQAQTASGSHFQFTKYTQWSYPVMIDTVDLNQTPMTAGDEIGIFDGDLCVGAGVFQGSFPLVISTWKDDFTTPNILDGYLAGHEMTFVWFDASSNSEITFVLPPTVQASEDDPVAPMHSCFGAGVYALRSMVYGAQSVLQLPTEYKLKQNYPNPFNAVTAIPFDLPQRSKVRVELYNVRGQLVSVLFDGIKPAGYEKIVCSARDFASGVYFYRASAEGLERDGKFNSVGKMLLLK